MIENYFTGKHQTSSGSPASDKASKLKGALFGALALTLISATGGALGVISTTSYSHAQEANTNNDPLESLNRATFSFNKGLDRVLIKPAAKAYGYVPEMVRTAIRNFLDNLRTPVILVNDLVQAEGNRAGVTFGRFATNTTFGIGGLFDPAGDYFDLPRHDEDFGQTIGVWGAGEGAYLVLPLFGPSSIRDGIGMGVDIAINPLTWIYANNDIEWIGAVTGIVSGIDLRERNLDTLDEIERSSIDYYAKIRSLYRQYRADAIRNGVPAPIEDMPEFSGDAFEYSDMEFEDDSNPDESGSQKKG